MAELKARVQITLRPAVPMPHERDLSFLPIAETRTSEGDRRQIGRLFVNCKIRIIGRRVRVVIAVLIMKNKWIAEFVAGVGETFHAVPAASGFRRRQGIGMLPVVAEMRPAGNEHERLTDAGSFQSSQLLRTLVEREQFVV